MKHDLVGEVGSEKAEADGQGERETTSVRWFRWTEGKIQAIV